MENRDGTGFMERGYFLLHEQSVQPNLSAFLRHHNQRLFRVDDLNTTDPEVMDRFLLDTPVDLLVSGAPPLYQWWLDRATPDAPDAAPPVAEEDPELAPISTS